MATYRWLSKSEAKALFPNEESTQRLVQKSSGSITATQWARRLLEIADSPNCERLRARRYVAAANAVRVKP